jgi:molecular chaperone DnaJ
LATKRDYYEVLGISKDASADDIKKAYRKLAKQYHPDTNKEDAQAEHKFKEVNEAYQILSDDGKRRQYDSYGHAAFDGTGGFSGGGYGGFEDVMGGFGDVFDSLFGGAFGRSSRKAYNGPQQGADLRYDMSITFEEAVFGCKKEIDLTKEEKCDECDGTGAQKGTQKKTCSVCGGSGQVRQQRTTAFGNFVNVTACSACGGEGTIIEKPCQKCRGKGTINKAKKLSITIPAGIDNGQALTLSGEGAPGKKGGPSGDLYIYITVKAHKYLQRDGFDLYLDMPVSFALAAMGGELEVPTLEGKIKYKIPEGTPTGTVFRLKEKGVKHLRSAKKGDMYVKVTVEVPKKLTDKQKDLLDQFEKISMQKEKSFFERVKDAFGGGA